MSAIQALEKLVEAINHYNAGHAAWEDLIKVKDEVVNDYDWLKDKIDDLFRPLIEHKAKQVDDDATTDEDHTTSISFDGIDPNQAARAAGRVHPPRDETNRKTRPPFDSNLSPISKASNHELSMGKDVDLEHEYPISVTNLPTTTNMSDNPNGVKGNVKETPISKAQATYGLPNTHTTIIPYNVCMYAGGFGQGGFHVDGVTKNPPGIRLDIPMTAPGLRIRNTFGNNSVSTITDTGVIPNNFQSTSTAQNISLGYGTIVQKVDNYDANYVDPESGYETSTARVRTVSVRLHTTAKAARPFFLEHFKEDYEYYTVTGCEYDIRIESLATRHGDDFLIGETFTGARKPPMNNKITVAGQTTDMYVSVNNALGWKNVTWHRLNGSNKRNVLNIRGVYHPGDLKREVIDDDKVKTWYTTNPWVNPSLQEDLTLMFFKHPQSSSAYTDGGVCNIYIQLKYIVQFKDLHQYKRYITGLYYLPADDNGDTQVASEADVTALTDETAGMDGDQDTTMGES